MGVLSCSRSGCTNIMCDRLSYTYGYLCNECFHEMVDSGKSIAEFMETYKDSNTTLKIPEEYYENEFPLMED